MQQLELRFYSRKEIAEELNIVDMLKSHHFSEKVRTILKNWGYEFESVPRKGYNIIRKPETAYEKLKEIMIRHYEIGSKIDAKALSIYLALALKDKKFASSPYSEKKRILEKYIGYEISEATLRTWTSLLVGKEIIYKDDNEKTYWKTYFNNNGKKVREQVDKEDEERKEYWQMFWELKESKTKYIYDILWDTFNASYYSCGSLIFTAWNNDPEALEEVIELANEIATKELQI